MIYLNQAATSFPKPPAVVEAVAGALQEMPAGALRSTRADSHDPAPARRTLMASLLHTPHADRIFFSSGATDSLNRLIGGLGPVRMAVLSDNHNSVLRPLFNGVGRLPDVLISVDQVEHLEADWLVVPHCSNVTGTVYDLARLCRTAHARGAKVLVDAAQSVGCVPVDVEGWGIDALAFTGHKALYGPQGTGGYYVSPDVALRPTVFGGTGTDSSILQYDEDAWEYEPGTPNGPGLAGLLAGVRYVMELGVEHIQQQLQSAIVRLIAGLERLPYVKVYPSVSGVQGPLVSFCVGKLQPADVGYILQNVYGITVRTGMHCAPLAHRCQGTAPYGTVRVSLSTFNTPHDIDALLKALAEITSQL